MRPSGSTSREGREPLLPWRSLTICEVLPRVASFLLSRASPESGRDDRVGLQSGPGDRSPTGSTPRPTRFRRRGSDAAGGKRGAANRLRASKLPRGRIARRGCGRHCWRSAVIRRRTGRLFQASVIRRKVRLPLSPCTGSSATVVHATPRWTPIRFAALHPTSPGRPPGLRRAALRDLAGPPSRPARSDRSCSSLGPFFAGPVLRWARSSLVRSILLRHGDRSGALSFQQTSLPVDLRRLISAG